MILGCISPIAHTLFFRLAFLRIGRFATFNLIYPIPKNTEYNLRWSQCAGQRNDQNPSRFADDSTSTTSLVACEKGVPGASASSASRYCRRLIFSATPPATW